MADEREWQRQLIGAAMSGIGRMAMEYVTNPKARDATAEQVKSKLAEVDYPAAAKAFSKAIDQLAESSKLAVSDAIDALRENAEGAVEMAATRAQEQLGVKPKKGGKKLLFGILLGIVLGFILLNEDRRNMVMEKISGDSGPTNNDNWAPIVPPARAPEAEATESDGKPAAESPATSTSDETNEVPVASAPSKPKSESKSRAKSEETTDNGTPV